jgi:hypothetical protein
VLLFAGCSKDDIPGISDPEYFTSDIDLFWRVFDSTSTNYSAAEFQDLYVNMGTDGLRDYAGQKGLASSLQSTLRSERYLAYYRAIRENTRDLSGVIQISDRGFSELKKIHPETRFYRVYFLMGALTAGGRVSDNGLLVAVEMFSKNTNTPIGNLSDWHQAVIRNKEYLPSIVLHEFVHKQQAFRRQNSGYATLLEQSIVEGMADFVSYYLLDGEPFVNEHLHQYGDAKEKELWLQFEAKMNGTSKGTEWLYSGESTSKGHPADMGYYMGYKIVEAFSENFLNRDDAVSAMLSMENYTSLLSQSKYADKFN